MVSKTIISTKIYFNIFLNIPAAFAKLVNQTYDPILGNSAFKYLSKFMNTEK